LAHFFFHDVGTFHNLIDFERLLAERPQDIFSIIQHEYAPTDTNDTALAGSLPTMAESNTAIQRFVLHRRSISFLRPASFLFLFCSMSHNHAKPMVTITMAMKMAYSIIGTSLSYLTNNVH
jgi:hypothetical protein